MATKYNGSNGGIAYGKIQRERALKKYLESPNYCKCCGSIILPIGKQRLRCVRRKKFCHHACSAKFNNEQREKKPKPLKIPRVRKTIDDRLKHVKKGDLFAKCKNWQSARTDIRKHAAFIAGESTPCKNCGYEHHTEICHKKAVADFDKESTIGEINHIDNLICLCPNCHWEFDNGKLLSEEIGCATPLRSEITTI